MHDRSIATRLRRGVAALLPVAAAAIAFAPAASAATTQPVVYTPTTTPALQADISSADGAAPGTLSIIQLGADQYTPTTSLPLVGDIEITGPPTYQTAFADSQDPNISGQIVFNIQPPVPLFEVTTGANVLFKGIDISAGGNGPGVAAVQVDPGGNVEIDNTGIIGSVGTGVELSGSGGSATITNSSISGGSWDGIEQNGFDPVTLINDTISYDGTGAIEGPDISVYNSYFFKTAQTSGTTCTLTSGDVFAGDYADPTGSTATSCGTTGITVTALASKTAQTGFYGGPSITTQLKAGNPAIGKGLAQYCPSADQRFFLYTPGTGGTCDVGSYQTTGVQDTSTSGPVCGSQSVNESSNPAVASTDTVPVSEPGAIGIGADGVNYTITSNGTVSYPVNGTSWFNATDGALTIDPSYPSTSAYPITATKPVGDLVVGDTMWSFYATDWLGNTTYCH